VSTQIKRKAIVTLAIGKKYKDIFNQYCRENWVQYCERYNFELIVVEVVLDESDRAAKRSVAWQKLLILSQAWSADYEQIVWVDSDIIINSQWAYDLTEDVPVEKVGAVDQCAIPTKEIFQVANNRLAKFWDDNNVNYIPGNFYTTRGIPGESLVEVMQSGVFVCSPIYHRQIFELIYYSYEDTRGSEWNYEMPAMSYELLTANLVTWISPRFNFCVINMLSAFYPNEMAVKPEGKLVNLLLRGIKKVTGVAISRTKTSKAQKQALSNIYDLSIFMHFAGCADLIPNMKNIMKNN
jgi:hypothetical protein